MLTIINFDILPRNTNLSMWSKVHIQDELMHHNVNFIDFNVLDYINFNDANESLLNYVKKNKVDLIFTMSNEDVLYIDTIVELKKYGIPTCLFCATNVVTPYEHKYCCKYFDLVWLTDRSTKEYFKNWGANIIIQPYAANPYLKTQQSKEICGISFVGSPYGSRVDIINRLTASSINVYVYNKNINKQYIEIKDFNNKKMIKKYAKIFLQYLYYPNNRKVIASKFKALVSKNYHLKYNSYLHSIEPCKPENVYCEHAKYALSLSSTALGNTGFLKKPVNMLNLRAFEIPMAYGIEFCRYIDEINEYFDDGKEIILYKDNEEMIDKAKYYICDKNVDIRKKIRYAARTRAENDHTWWKRFKKVFFELGIKYE